MSAEDTVDDVIVVVVVDVGDTTLWELEDCVFATVLVPTRMVLVGLERELGGEAFVFLGDCSVGEPLLFLLGEDGCLFLPAASETLLDEVTSAAAAAVPFFLLSCSLFNAAVSNAIANALETLPPLCICSKSNAFIGSFSKRNPECSTDNSKNNGGSMS